MKHLSRQRSQLKSIFINLRFRFWTSFVTFSARNERRLLIQLAFVNHCYPRVKATVPFKGIKSIRSLSIRTLRERLISDKLLFIYIIHIWVNKMWLILEDNSANLLELRLLAETNVAILSQKYRRIAAIDSWKRYQTSRSMCWLALNMVFVSVSVCAESCFNQFFGIQFPLTKLTVRLRIFMVRNKIL